MDSLRVAGLDSPQAVLDTRQVAAAVPGSRPVAAVPGSRPAGLLCCSHLHSLQGTAAPVGAGHNLLAAGKPFLPLQIRECFFKC